MASLEDARVGSLVERTWAHFVAIDYGYLKLDGTEDDDDDDEVAQNKLLILVAIDVSCNLSARKRSE